jgi:hypothetical protein
MIKSIVFTAFTVFLTSQLYSQQTVNNLSPDQPKRQITQPVVLAPATVFLSLNSQSLSKGNTYDTDK